MQVRAMKAAHGYDLRAPDRNEKPGGHNHGYLPTSINGKLFAKVLCLLSNCLATKTPH